MAHNVLSAACEEQNPCRWAMQLPEALIQAVVISESDATIK